MASFWKKFTSGLDFWDKDENRRQREQYAREDEEERRRRQQAQAARSSFSKTQAPGTVFSPTTSPTLDAPLKKPGLNVGSQSSIEDMLRPQKASHPILKEPTTEQKAEALRRNSAEAEINELTAKRLPRYIDQAKKQTSWFDRQFTNRNWDKKAEALARSSALIEYQEKHGFNKQPEVMANTERVKKELNQPAGTSKAIAPVLSVGRVGTGIVEGGAGLYDMVASRSLNPEKKNRVTQAATKKAEEIDQLARDMDMEGLYKGINVPLEIATYFSPGVLTKAGKVGKITSKVSSKADDILMQGKNLPKLRKFASETIDDLLDPRNLEMEARLTGRYMGQDSARGENIDKGDIAENAGMAVAGAMLPPFARRALRKLTGKNTNVADEAAIISGGGALNRAGDAISNTPEATKIPGTIPEIPEPTATPPKVSVADGVKTTPTEGEAIYSPREAAATGENPYQDLNTTTPSYQTRDARRAAQTTEDNARLERDRQFEVDNPDPYEEPAFLRRNPALREQSASDSIREGAGDFAKDPRFADQVNESFRITGSQDPMGLAMNTLIRTNDKRLVRSILETLVPGIEGNALNQAVKTITRTNEAGAISDALSEAAARARGDLPFGAVSTAPAPNIPDVANPIALAKAAEVENIAPPKVSAAGADAQGNLVKATDAQLARELAEQGVPVTPGRSVVEASEEATQRAADEAATAQVGTTAPEERLAYYTDPNTGQTIAMSADDVIDEIIDLQSIPRDRRTVAQATKLKDLTNVYKNWDEMSAPMSRPTVDDLYPGMSPAGREGVQQTLDQLDNARQANNDLKKTRSEERGDRIAAGDAAYEAAGGGEAGMRAKMNQLKGEYSKSDYEPVNISEEARVEVLDDIQRSNKLRPFEKMNTQRAFEKMWGTIDEKPLPSDIRKIRNYYNSKQEGLGDLVADKLKEAVKGGEDFKLVEQLAGAPRTMMTTLDFSSPRQAGVLMARHPIEGTKAFLNGVINAFRPNRFSNRVDDMVEAVDANGANYSDFMNDMMGLHLPSVAEQAAEEAMSSAPLLSKIPVYGQVIKASNRSFSGTLSELRFNVAKNWIDNHGGIDEVMKNYSAKELEDLGEALNTLSGRGGKAGGFVDKHASILSKTLFSGRLWASRLNMLNPYWYYRLSAPARKEALTSAAAFSALAGTVLAIAQNAGAEVETDPRSADFAKIKVGNTRYDIMGGLQQNIRVASQVLTGSKINSATGEEQDVTPFKAIAGFAEGKLNPLLGFALNMSKTSDFDDGNPLTRTDEYGNEVNVGWETAKLGLPLPLSEIAETSADVGSTVKGALMNVPGFFGAGVQTYGDSKNKPLTRDKAIEDALANGEYDRAIQGYEYLLEKENSKREPNQKKVQELQDKVERATMQRDDIPTDKDMVKTYAENGEFDKAITGLQYVMKTMDRDKKLAKSDKVAMEQDIKRLEVTRDGKYPPEIMKMYESVGVEDWRAMDDPESPLYDPELFELLAQYDEHLKKNGVSRKGDGKLNKYYASKSGGRGRGSGGSDKPPRFITDIATNRFTEGDTFRPMKAEPISPSIIPTIAPVPDYDTSKLKKISVTRGRR